MKNKVLANYCFSLMAILFFCSCAHYKDVPYFQNSDQFDGSKGAVLYDMKVQPKDELTIYVFSGNDQEVVAPFNLRIPNNVRFPL